MSQAGYIFAGRQGDLRKHLFAERVWSLCGLVPWTSVSPVAVADIPRSQGGRWMTPTWTCAGCVAVAEGRQLPWPPLSPEEHRANLQVESGAA